MARHRSIDIKTDALETGGAGIQRAVKEQGRQASDPPSDQVGTAQENEGLRSTKRPPRAPAASTSAAQQNASFGAPSHPSAQTVRPRTAKEPPQEEETARRGILLLAVVLLFAIPGYFFLPFIGVNVPRPSFSFLSFLPFIGTEQTNGSGGSSEETEEYNHLIPDVDATQTLNADNANRTELLRALEEIREESTGVTAILLVTQETQREEGRSQTAGTRSLNARELFQQLGFEVDAALPFTITTYTLGFLPGNEMFFAAQVRSRDTARGALYTWEDEMMGDLSPLFGFDRTGFSQAVFKDRIVSGYDARVLISPTSPTSEQSAGGEVEEDVQSEREFLAYAFPREQMFVIGSSPEALESILDMLETGNAESE